MLQSRVVLSNGYLFKNMVVITIWPLLRYLRIPTNHIGCVMVSVVRTPIGSNQRLYNTVVSNHFHSVKFSSAKPRDFDGMLGFGLPVSMYTTKTPIDKCRFNVTQLKYFFTFSVKYRYQLNYFICIKDFNAQTITSLKLNLFYFYIYCCQHHERKTTCLDIFLLSDRQ